MATITGQATDPQSPGVQGRPMDINVPGPAAIGVLGNGGKGVPPAQLPGGGQVPGRQGFGVWATTDDPNGAGISAVNTAGGWAGEFNPGILVAGGIEADQDITAKANVNVAKDVIVQGSITVAKDITVSGDVILANADCAEEFDIASLEEATPGTVMSLGSDGKLHPCLEAYDTRVIGVISGAGCYRPAIILDKNKSSGHPRGVIALMGKVYVKVDAQYGSIELGDLLTPSPTPGHAMKATDPTRAFGSVIGKALGSLSEGQDVVPILISLQ